MYIWICSDSSDFSAASSKEWTSSILADSYIEVRAQIVVEIICTDLVLLDIHDKGAKDWELDLT